MVNFARLRCAVPFVSALLLAACGGGGAASTQVAQQSDQSVLVKFDTAPFIATAAVEDCAETRNRLFVIDQKYVYWDRAGNCPDNAYAQRLFGDSLDKVLCTQNDSIAGAQQYCPDAASTDLFKQLVKNGAAAELVLSGGHTVLPLKLDTGINVSFDTIIHSDNSLITTAQHRTVKDLASWQALWREHAGDAPVPTVDFSKKMVIATFLGNTDFCHDVSIVHVARTNGELLVTQIDTLPAIGVTCVTVAKEPAFMVSVDRDDEPVHFVEVQKRPQL